MLVLREENDRTNRVIVPTSHIGVVIDEEHQGHGTAHVGEKGCFNAWCTPTIDLE